jgi:hypothetical protein
MTETGNRKQEAGSRKQEAGCNIHALTHLNQGERGTNGTEKRASEIIAMYH